MIISIKNKIHTQHNTHSTLMAAEKGLISNIVIDSHKSKVTIEDSISQVITHIGVWIYIHLSTLKRHLVAIYNIYSHRILSFPTPAAAQPEGTCSRPPSLTAAGLLSTPCPQHSQAWTWPPAGLGECQFSPCNSLLAGFTRVWYCFFHEHQTNCPTWTLKFFPFCSLGMFFCFNMANYVHSPTASNRHITVAVLAPGEFLALSPRLDKRPFLWMLRSVMSRSLLGLFSCSILIFRRVLLSFRNFENGGCFLLLSCLPSWPKHMIGASEALITVPGD